MYSWIGPGDRCRQNLDYVHVKHGKEYKDYADAGWSFSLTASWECKNVHYIEENNGFPKGKYKMEWEIITRSTTEGGEFCRR